MISIQDLHKAFGKNKVLKGIDLSFSQPEITAILGPNGSGKTTLIKCILGMVNPDKGKIVVQGSSIKDNWKYRDQINYLPQIAQFPENLRVSELIDMIKDLRQRTTDDQRLIDLFELTPFLDEKLRNLSGGTRQKVNLVLAFMYNSPIIILDEPTAGLDPLAIQTLKKLLNTERQKGKIILLTTHIMSLVDEVAEKVVFLLEGKLYFQGEIDEMKKEHRASSTEKAIAKILKRNQAKQLLENLNP